MKFLTNSELLVIFIELSFIVLVIVVFLNGDEFFMSFGISVKVNNVIAVAK